MLRISTPKERLNKERQLPFALTSRDQFDRVVDESIIECFKPDTPFISGETRVVTLGSCFAQNIAADLYKANYPILSMSVSERLFNAFALQQFVEGLVSRDVNLSALTAHWNIKLEEITDIHDTIRDGAIVIITYGLDLVWFDNNTDETILDPAEKVGPKLILNEPQRYEMRVTSVHDNLDAMIATINAIRTINPFAKVILTLSPVHLSRAVCDYPGIVADSISKSTLRCALHEFMALKLPNVFYFPSFEILRWFAPMLESVSFEDGILRHLKKEWIEYTLSKFKQYHCVGEQPFPPLLKCFANE